MFAEHGLPSVLQLALSGAHVPPLHEPPQHSPSALHDAPSAVHWWSEHTLPMQLTEQQSVFAEHDVPAMPHTVGFAEHAPCGSQVPEQQVSPAVHAVPNTPHGCAASAPLPDFLPPPQAARIKARIARRAVIVLVGPSPRNVATNSARLRRRNIKQFRDHVGAGAETSRPDPYSLKTDRGFPHHST